MKIGKKNRVIQLDKGTEAERNIYDIKKLDNGSYKFNGATFNGVDNVLDVYFDSKAITNIGDIPSYKKIKGRIDGISENEYKDYIKSYAESILFNYFKNFPINEWKEDAIRRREESIKSNPKSDKRDLTNEELTSIIMKQMSSMSEAEAAIGTINNEELYTAVLDTFINQTPEYIEGVLSRLKKRESQSVMRNRSAASVDDDARGKGENLVDAMFNNYINMYITEMRDPNDLKTGVQVAGYKGGIKSQNEGSATVAKQVIDGFIKSVPSEYIEYFKREVANHNAFIGGLYKSYKAKLQEENPNEEPMTTEQFIYDNKDYILNNYNKTIVDQVGSNSSSVPTNDLITSESGKKFDTFPEMIALSAYTLWLSDTTGAKYTDTVWFDINHKDPTGDIYENDKLTVALKGVVDAYKREYKDTYEHMSIDDVDEAFKIVSGDYPAINGAHIAIWEANKNTAPYNNVNMFVAKLITEYKSKPFGKNLSLTAIERDVYNSTYSNIEGYVPRIAKKYVNEIFVNFNNVYDITGRKEIVSTLYEGAKNKLPDVKRVEVDKEYNALENIKVEDPIEMKKELSIMEVDDIGNSVDIFGENIYKNINKRQLNEAIANINEVIYNNKFNDEDQTNNCLISELARILLKNQLLKTSNGKFVSILWGNIAKFKKINIDSEDLSGEKIDYIELISEESEDGPVLKSDDDLFDALNKLNHDGHIDSHLKIVNPLVKEKLKTILDEVVNEVSDSEKTTHYKDSDACAYKNSKIENIKNAFDRRELNTLKKEDYILDDEEFRELNASEAALDKLNALNVQLKGYKEGKIEVNEAIATSGILSNPITYDNYTLSDKLYKNGDKPKKDGDVVVYANYSEYEKFIGEFIIYVKNNNRILTDLQPEYEGYDFVKIKELNKLLKDNEFVVNKCIDMSNYNKDMSDGDTVNATCNMIMYNYCHINATYHNTLELYNLFASQWFIYNCVLNSLTSLISKNGCIFSDHWLKVRDDWVSKTNTINKDDKSSIINLDDSVKYDIGSYLLNPNLSNESSDVIKYKIESLFSPLIHSGDETIQVNDETDDKLLPYLESEHIREITDLLLNDKVFNKDNKKLIGQILIKGNISDDDNKRIIDALDASNRSNRVASKYFILVLNGAILSTVSNKSGSRKGGSTDAGNVDLKLMSFKTMNETEKNNIRIKQMLGTESLSEFVRKIINNVAKILYYIGTNKIPPSDYDLYNKSIDDTINKLLSKYNIKDLSPNMVHAALTKLGHDGLSASSAISDASNHNNLKSVRENQIRTKINKATIKQEFINNINLDRLIEFNQISKAEDRSPGDPYPHLVYKAASIYKQIHMQDISVDDDTVAKRFFNDVDVPKDNLKRILEAANTLSSSKFAEDIGEYKDDLLISNYENNKNVNPDDLIFASKIHAAMYYYAIYSESKTVQAYKYNDTFVNHNDVYGKPYNIVNENKDDESKKLVAVTDSDIPLVTAAKGVYGVGNIIDISYAEGNAMVGDKILSTKENHTFNNVSLLLNDLLTTVLSNIYTYKNLANEKTLIFNTKELYNKYVTTSDNATYNNGTNININYIQSQMKMMTTFMGELIAYLNENSYDLPSVSKPDIIKKLTFDVKKMCNDAIANVTSSLETTTLSEVNKDKINGIIKGWVNFRIKNPISNVDIEDATTEEENTLNLLADDILKYMDEINEILSIIHANPKKKKGLDLSRFDSEKATFAENFNKKNKGIKLNYLMINDALDAEPVEGLEESQRATLMDTLQDKFFNRGAVGDLIKQQQQEAVEKFNLIVDYIQDLLLEAKILKYLEFLKKYNVKVDDQSVIDKKQITGKMMADILINNYNKVLDDDISYNNYSVLKGVINDYLTRLNELIKLFKTYRSILSMNNKERAINEFTERTGESCSNIEFTTISYLMNSGVLKGKKDNGTISSDEEKTLNNTLKKLRDEFYGLFSIK